MFLLINVYIIYIVYIITLLKYDCIEYHFCYYKMFF